MTDSHRIPSVEIRICPTDMEMPDGSLIDETRLLYALRMFLLGRFGQAVIDISVGYRQGVEYARIDGDEDAGRELMEEFDATGVWSDEEIYV